MTEYSYIYIIPTGMSKSGLTGTWEIADRKDGYLGHIAWYGPWRQYCFFPEPNCIFSIGCLADISGFINEQMDEWKARRQ